MLKEALIALSLANLCFFSVWDALLPGSALQYFLDRPPSQAAFASVLLDVLLLSAVFWLLSRFGRRFFPKRYRDISRCVFLCVVILIFNSIRKSAGIIPETKIFSGHSDFLAQLDPLAVVAVLGAVGLRNRLAPAGKAVVLILCPLVLVTFGLAVWSLLSYQSLEEKFSPALAPRLAGVHPDSPRVVWLLFDELDQQLAFDERPADLNLRELDRFRRQAIYATQASPVASNTTLAMPALIMGKPVSKAKPVNVSTLRVTLADSGETADWAAQPSLFAEARGRGFNTGVVGFYHPYCRIVNRSVTECSSWGYHWAYPRLMRQAAIFTLPEMMINHFTGVLAEVPLGDLLRVESRFLARFKSIRTKRINLDGRLYRGVLNEAKKIVTDPDLSLILVHLPVPHAPFIYDRFNGEREGGWKSDYLDNLVLADQTLGELRRAMEDAGVWDSSTVLVTSDHWYRGKPKEARAWEAEGITLSTYRDYRVPLLIKLPGQQRGVTYAAPFSTILTHDLILALLSNGSEISQPEAVLRWLDDHRTVAPPFCDEEIDGCGPDGRLR